MSKHKESQDSHKDLRESELCPPNLLRGQERAFAKDIKRYQKRRCEFVFVRCPACKKKNSRKVFEKFTFIYRQCLHCKTIFMSPRPTARQMHEYYANSENYRYWAKYIFPAYKAIRKDKINRPRLEEIIEICKTHKIPRTHLVEIGAGFGSFAELVKTEKAFRSVTAVEPTPEMAEQCRKRGIKVFQKRIEDLNNEVPKANVVVAFEVIEHLFDANKFFLQVKKLLAPKSILVITCPNSQGFDILTLGKGSLAVDAEHVNLFNPFSISILGSRNGFKVVNLKTPGKLDTELVRNSLLKNKYILKNNKFLEHILINKWETYGEKFQNFLAENLLSSHMITFFQKNK